MNNKPIILIDGSSFIFRAFYAVRELSAPDGTPTNAIYGVINMIKQMQKKYDTPYWVCVFDAKGKTFRDDLYPEYKATRKETPDELKSQIPVIHEIISDLGIPVIVQSGVEADDVIATIAKHYASLDYQILVATGDKDFAQIVDENITLINTMTSEVLDTDGVFNKFGVKPEQIIDYLTLIGDTVDNVPGVMKCGPKTAQKWLTQYETLDNIIEHKDEITGAIGENLKAALSWLPLSKQLITIDTQVKIDNFDINNINDLTVKTPDNDKLVDVFRKLNFRTWLKEVEANLLSTDKSVTNDNDSTVKTNAIKFIDKVSELESIYTDLQSNNPIAIQLINQNHSEYDSEIIAVSIEINDSSYWYKIKFANSQDGDLFADNTTDEFYNITKKIIESNINKIVYDYKNFLYQCNAINITPKNIAGDIQLLHYVKQSNLNHDLSYISDTPSLAEIFGKGASIKLFEHLSFDEQNNYLNSNSNILAAHKKIFDSLNSSEQNLYQNIELPIAHVLYQMENEGITLDAGKLKELEILMTKEVSLIESQIFAESKQVFNINSPKQLQDVLFNQMGLPTDNIRKITSGYSTDEESLNILAEQNIPIANYLLEYRSLTKLLNTYITKLPNYLDANKKIHSSFEQTVVTSGRLSSKDPNLQNIPVRNEYGQKIRECFIPSKKNVMICADYSQIELRILAHISQDESLIKAFHDNIDIHTLTASQIFSKQIEEVTKDERRYAKSINFGLIYGKSAFGLAKELKIDRSAAKLYIDNYFARFPKVKQYMENIKEYAHQHGFVETVLGRKIYLPNINNKNRILSQADERLALNAPMQGSAADIIKIAMINIDKWILENKLQSKMILQVHDELIFDVTPEEVDIFMQNIPRLMDSAYKLLVPLTVEIKKAVNWNAAH